jgi:hypothetical protein
MPVLLLSSERLSCAAALRLQTRLDEAEIYVWADCVRILARDRLSMGHGAFAACHCCLASSPEAYMCHERLPYCTGSARTADTPYMSALYWARHLDSIIHHTCLHVYIYHRSNIALDIWHETEQYKGTVKCEEGTRRSIAEYVHVRHDRIRATMPNRTSALPLP